MKEMLIHALVGAGSGMLLAALWYVGGQAAALAFAIP